MNIPATLSQRLLWMASGATPGALTLFILASSPVRLDADVTRAALQGLVERHGALRTAFPVVGGRLTQLALDATEPGLLCFDRAPVSPAAFAGGVRALLDEPVDGARAPTLRARLFDVEGAGSGLLLDVSHLALDALACRHLLADFALAYEALLAGREAPARSVPAAAAGRDGVTDGRAPHGAALDFWRDELAGTPPPGPPPSRVEREARVVPAELWAALGRRRRASGASLAAVLLAAAALRAWRSRGGRDVVVGVITSGRRSTAAYRRVGCFINAVPVRVRLGGDASPAGALAAATAALGRALEAECAFEDVARAVGRVRPFDLLLNEAASAFGAVPPPGPPWARGALPGVVCEGRFGEAVPLHVAVRDPATMSQSVERLTLGVRSDGFLLEWMGADAGRDLADYFACLADVVGPHT